MHAGTGGGVDADGAADTGALVAPSVGSGRPGRYDGAKDGSTEEGVALGDAVGCWDADGRAPPEPAMPPTLPIPSEPRPSSSAFSPASPGSAPVPMSGRVSVPLPLFCVFWSVITMVRTIGVATASTTTVAA
ncbi:MAG: hypothetical protein HOV94_39795, partial [Saccharothrix sp.]|nr:hypothetical protein [Saccharothrix sp.]